MIQALLPSGCGDRRSLARFEMGGVGMMIQGSFAREGVKLLTEIAKPKSEQPRSE